MYKELFSLNPDESFNLREFWNQYNPKTPPHDMHIHMRRFELNSLRDAIILNLCNQNLHIQPALTSSLMKYLSQNFEDITHKVNLQLLLHYSKMDVDLLYKRYNAFYELRSTLETKLTKDEFYSRELLSFISCAMESPIVEKNTVHMMSTECREYVVKCLLSKPMIEAFKAGLSRLLEPDNICESEIVKEINCMQIYTVKQSGTLSSLRGACLIDGILVCAHSLAAYDTNKADLITLAAHECCHYLVRLHMKNFNFSSPFQLGDKCRVDSGRPQRSLEMGRQVELLLFDQVQPDWFNSSPLAAITFLERLCSPVTNLPVIKKSEHKKLKLAERVLPSAPFGIDLEEKYLHFC